MKLIEAFLFAFFSGFLPPINDDVSMDQTADVLVGVIMCRHPKRTLHLDTFVLLFCKGDIVSNQLQCAACRFDRA